MIISGVGAVLLVILILLIWCYCRKFHSQRKNSKTLIIPYEEKASINQNDDTPIYSQLQVGKTGYGDLQPVYSEGKSRRWTDKLRNNKNSLHSKKSMGSNDDPRYDVNETRQSNFTTIMTSSGS